jgi:Peptidase family M23
MPITPLATPYWLFVPPLELPLTLRIENGRFGALRPKPLPRQPPCATTQFIPAGDPRNPTSGDVYVANQIHEAVDLAAAADDCVFAAYSGRVVDVEAAAVTIDHHPEGLGFVTKYIHIDHIAVAPGNFVQKGMPFAAVSTEPTEPHLHFELWAVVDGASAGAPDWPGDTDLVPLDPTRALYAWEQRTLADEAFGDGAASAAVDRAGEPAHGSVLHRDVRDHRPASAHVSPDDGGRAAGDRPAAGRLQRERRRHAPHALIPLLGRPRRYPSPARIAAHRVSSGRGLSLRKNSEQISIRVRNS